MAAAPSKLRAQRPHLVAPLKERHQADAASYKGAPNIAIAGLADASLDVDRRAGLPPSRGQAEGRRNITRATEARRIIDRRHEAQRRHRTYAESP
jgi:hypothetical protein